MFNDRCDESKCVSKGFSVPTNPTPYTEGFTCLASDDTFDPMMCANGYLPKLVEENTDGVSPQFIFTCCPPGHTTQDTSRHCTLTPFPILVNETSFIDNEPFGRQCSHFEGTGFPRRMKPGRQGLESYICCDSPLAPIDYKDKFENSDTGSEISYLDETECVPYRNEFYEVAMAQNEYGKIAVMSCDFAPFLFPRSTEGMPINEIFGDGMTSSEPGRYMCCRSGPALPPYVPDLVFRQTLYPTIVLSCLAAFFSLIVAIAIVIPLCIQRKNISNQKKEQWRVRETQSGEVIPTDTSPPAHSGEMTISERRFTIFNVYLMYLAFAYSLYNFLLFSMYVQIANQKFNPNFHSYIVSPPEDDSMGPLYSQEWEIVIVFSNFTLWISAVMLYQIRMLLQKSKTREPSLTRGILRGVGILLVSVALGVIDVSVRSAARKAMNNGDTEKNETLLRILLFWNATLVTIPIVYIFYTHILIGWKGYLPSLKGSDSQGKAMRELALYVFRIIAVILTFWIPTVVCPIFSVGMGTTWAFPVASICASIQAILTMCTVLGQTDVRNYVWDLVTLSYVFDRKQGKQTTGQKRQGVNDFPWVIFCGAAEDDTQSESAYSSGIAKQKPGSKEPDADGI